MSIMNRVGDWITGSQIWGSIFRHGAPSALALLAGPLAAADPFYLRYDADGVFPEEAGWTRNYDDADGQEVRGVADGVLTVDSRASRSIFDTYRVQSDALNLNSGEQLVISWRSRTLYTDPDGLPYSDVNLLIVNGQDQLAQFFLGNDYIAEREYLFDHPELYSAFSPGWHDFQFVSPDLASFSIFVDSRFAFSGEFHGFAIGGPNRVAFGDMYVGLSSLSEWDFVDVQVTPEPASALGAILCAPILRRRRL